MGFSDWFAPVTLTPPTIKKESAWSFETFGSGGVGLALLAASGGTVVLHDPKGNAVEFWYGGLGAGLSIGLKIPGKLKGKLPPMPNGLKDKFGTIGPTSFPSMGKLYILSGFDKEELAKEDIQGPCAFVEVGAGIIGGGSGTAMLVGLDIRYLPFATSPIYYNAFLNTANGILMMAGLNAGLQFGAGASSLMGWLH